MGFPLERAVSTQLQNHLSNPKGLSIFKEIKIVLCEYEHRCMSAQKFEDKLGSQFSTFSYLEVGSSCSFCCILTVWAVSFRAILFLSLICTLRSLSSVGINRYCHHSGDRRQSQGADMIEKPSTIEFIPKPVTTLANVIYGGPTYRVL